MKKKKASDTLQDAEAFTLFGAPTMTRTWANQD
jgi:hypothetical protein